MPRKPITMKGWSGGINSLLPPTAIGDTQFAWGENIINRGGIIQTRPGRRVIASLPGANPQGIAIFTPTGSTPRIVAAIDGSVYVLAYPSFTPVKLPNIAFSPTAPFVQFCVTIKSIQRNPDNSLKIITPTNVLMMQDGTSQAAYWDGINSRHLNPAAPASETPIGLWMAWISDRLWIADGSRIFVGDLSDPLSHTEAIYLSERDNFQLPDVCNGLSVTPNRSGILAFCPTSTTLFQANVTDRTTWASTPNFQAVVLQNVGCVAGRTIVNQYGLTWWMSAKGIVNQNEAFSTNRSSELITADANMMRSKRQLAPDLSKCCSAAYGDFLLCSVPSAGLHNEHTWVMDQNPAGEGSPPVWASNWTGTRPIQWASGLVGGQDRLYSLSFDKSAMNDTRLHIWEDMLTTKTDQDGPIQCQFITGTISNSDPLRFKTAHFEAVEILDDVTLNVLVAGTHGPYYPIGIYHLHAEHGCFGSSIQPFITNDSIIQAYRPQARSRRTQEFDLGTKGATPEQKPYNAGLDKGFSLCFEWTGRMGLREITMIFGDGPDEMHGRPACGLHPETSINAVDEGGISVIQEQS